MLSPCRIVSLLKAGVFALCGGAVCGQTYPNKPIRIVTYPAGGGLDFTSRLIAQGIAGGLGQPLIIENRPGGVSLGEIVSKAPPDGYTLLVSGSALWLAPFFQSSVPYDPIKDFSPVTLVASSPNILVVHTSLPVKSVTDLIALAKHRSGALNYASAGAGGSTHLAAELFKAMAGVNIVRINYKGTAQALNDLLAGQVQLTFATPASVLQHVRSGRLRGIAVTGSGPFALFPGLPTVAASGLPGYAVESNQGMFAPAKTPEAIVKRLNQEIVKYLRTSDAQERFLNSGVAAVGNTPEQFTVAMQTEMTQLGKVIRDAGIKAD